MTPKKLQQAFEQWTRNDELLVLASVYETEGSTYSKTGAQMLINGAGDFRGMLSGGCLEGDLAERARAVIESRVPQAVTYDLGQDDEEIWGLGVGCDGLMRIFLQALLPANDYQPFAAMSRVYDGQEKQVAATVLESGVAGLAPGSSLVTVDGKTAFTDTSGQHRQAIEEFAASVLGSGESKVAVLGIGDATAKVLFSVLRPPPRVLVLGAGLDAEPVVRLATELGWRVTVQDHRPAYVEAGDFASAERVACVPVRKLQEEIDLTQFAAAIVMSHHLASDLEYLRQLATTHMDYVGLLGPRDRKRRLLKDLGELADRLSPRLHGPAGIDIGGRGPASIALSIVAEMHRELMQEDV